jgi:murein peptide amidase A
MQVQDIQTQGWIAALRSQSREEREIVLYVSGFEAPGPLDTLILAAMHGDERESQVLAAQFLASTPPDSLGERRVGVVPLVNPDGFERNQRVNANGVDLNRNYPTQDWAELNANTIYYSGPAAASEPETQFILHILEQYPPRKIITLHTPYKVINYDGPALALAETMAESNGYPVVADIGYVTPGSFGTYVGKERNIPTITLELPEEGFDQTVLEQNLQALKAGIFW